MSKSMSLAILLILNSPIALPTAASATPPSNTAENLAGCRELIADDPNVSLGGCLGFVQTIYASHGHGWIPHYCAGLEYYEPDVFSSLYDSQADCIIANQGDPPF